MVKQGFEGPIYATSATTELASVMIADSGHIQESDVEFVNKRRARTGELPVEPIYTKEDAERVAEFFKPVDYDQPFEPVKGVVACFMEAGHIFGSAAVSLEIEEMNRKIRFWFSGDIGRFKLRPSYA